MDKVKYIKFYFTSLALNKIYFTLTLKNTMMSSLFYFQRISNLFKYWFEKALTKNTETHISAKRYTNSSLIS